MTGRRPRGTIVQAESGAAHKEFVEAVEPDYVLIKIQYARQLLKRGITADERFPESCSVITSTAIRDNTNVALPLEGNDYKRGEWEIVRDFEPDFHIPADEATYTDFSDEKRKDRVKTCMRGTLTIANHVSDTGLDTTILPWIKGVKPEERKIAYRTIEQLGMDYAVFYANGYFNGRDGNYRRQLVKDLEYLIKEASEELEHTDELTLCVLNCQSPNILERLPDEVVASSGLWVGQNRGWREKVTPTKQSDEEMQNIFGSVDKDVRAALGLPDRDSEGVVGSPSAPGREARSSAPEFEE